MKPGSGDQGPSQLLDVLVLFVIVEHSWKRINMNNL